MTMTSLKPDTNPDGAPAPDTRLLERADAAFERAIAVLDASCRALESGPEISDAELTRAMRQMNGAFLLAIELQEKARAAGQKRDIGGGAALDLGAARSEIGLRLACLRDARDGGGLSGGAE